MLGPDPDAVNEYIWSLVMRDRQRLEDYAPRPVAMHALANDCMASADALDQTEKLQTIPEKIDSYDG